MFGWGLMNAGKELRGLGLINLYCRYLMNNLDWLSDALGDFEDDYVRLRFPVFLQLSLLTI